MWLWKECEMKNWYENTIIEEKIPDFLQSDIKGIKSFNYYIDFNEYYDEVSYLKVNFIVEKKEKKLEITMLFKEINGLKLEGFGGIYNQILGFNLEKQDKSYEVNNRYKLEDFEDGVIELFCKEFEILTVVEILHSQTK